MNGWRALEVKKLDIVQNEQEEDTELLNNMGILTAMVQVRMQTRVGASWWWWWWCWRRTCLRLRVINNERGELLMRRRRRARA